LFTDVSGQRIGSIFTGQDSEKTREDGTDTLSETSVNNYHTTPRNTPEERRSHQIAAEA
jgi:D-alanyl-D-alanine carboxypeptidase